jgi:hypothetical protein
MKTSDVSLERPVRVESGQPPVRTRVAASQTRMASPSPLGNVSLYIVPRISEDRTALIAKAAYLIAWRRGFAPGHEVEDWLAAENEVDQRLAGEGRVF